MTLYIDLTDNILTMMMGKLYETTKLSKGDPETPTWTEEITGTYNNEFMQVVNKDIKEIEQHGT